MVRKVTLIMLLSVSLFISAACGQGNKADISPPSFDSKVSDDKVDPNIRLKNISKIDILQDDNQKVTFEITVKVDKGYEFGGVTQGAQDGVGYFFFSEHHDPNSVDAYDYKALVEFPVLNEIDFQKPSKVFVVYDRKYKEDFTKYEEKKEIWTSE